MEQLQPQDPSPLAQDDWDCRGPTLHGETCEGWGTRSFVKTDLKKL